MDPFVEGNEHSKLGAGVEKPCPLRVLPHHAHRVILRNTVLPICQEPPILPEVVGEEDVGTEVVVPVFVDCHHCPAMLILAQVD